MGNTLEKTPLKIAIVAGERSGDELGAPLMKSLKSINPSIEFVGVGGSKMTVEGLESYFDMREISVMGIIEPLLNLRKLLKLRKGLKKYLLQQNPDIFIGIDSPDFNLPVANFLKKESSNQNNTIRQSFSLGMAKRSNKIYGEINRFCFNPFSF